MFIPVWLSSSGLVTLCKYWHCSLQTVYLARPVLKSTLQVKRVPLCQEFWFGIHYHTIQYLPVQYIVWLSRGTLSHSMCISSIVLILWTKRMELVCINLARIRFQKMWLDPLKGFLLKMTKKIQRKVWNLKSGKNYHNNPFQRFFIFLLFFLWTYPIYSRIYSNWQEVKTVFSISHRGEKPM